MYLLFPLAASLLYVTAILFLKRAADLGAGIWRTTFIANLVTACMFSLLLLQGGTFPGWWAIYQPAIVAGCFLVGQMLQFLAIERGDVTIATPVLGTKIILVAALQTVLTAEPVTPLLWLAAGLAVVAVMLLNSSGGGHHEHVGWTIAISFCSGGCFALFDVLVQKWAPGWKVGLFLPVMFAFVAAYSFVFPFFFHAPLTQISRPAWKVIFLGSLFIGGQALAIICGIGLFGHATEMNVVYSARGLWSVVAVWLIGHWFANREQKLAAKILRRRLAGAALLTTAIVLVLI